MEELISEYGGVMAMLILGGILIRTLAGILEAVTGGMF